MIHLGSWDGPATAFDGEEELGPVEFELDFYQEPSGMRSGGGFMDGEAGVMGRCFNARELRLKCDEGEFKAVLTSSNEFTLSGPPPGVID